MPEQRKRRKVEILGTFAQYKEQQEEHKQSENGSEQAMSRRQSMHEALGDKSKGQLGVNTTGPNIIGNVEDMQGDKSESGQHYPSLSNMNKDEQMSVGGESSQFKDITGSLVHTRRNKSKQRK